MVLHYSHLLPQDRLTGINWNDYTYLLRALIESRSKSVAAVGTREGLQK